MAKGIDVWRDIPGTEGKYRASRFGEIARVCEDGSLRRLKTTRYRGGGSRGIGGYARVMFRLSGRRISFGVARCVWTAFRGEVPEGLYVTHRNGLTMDNALCNLALSRSSIDRDIRRRLGLRGVEVVDRSGKVVESYDTTEECAEAYGIKCESVRRRIWRGRHGADTDLRFRRPRGR